MLVETIVNQFSFNNAAGKRGQDHPGQLLQTRNQGFSASNHLAHSVKGVFLKKVAYILSLGVCEEFRKQGIASLLLENLISHLTSEAFEVRSKSNRRSLNLPFFHLRWWRRCTCTYSQRIVLRSLFTSIEDSIYTPSFLSTMLSRGGAGTGTQR